jgi:hypothetical protein
VTEPNNYGKYYWCIKVPESISEDGEIYLNADRVELRDGALIFSGKFYPSARDGYPDYENPKDNEEKTLLILNKEQWLVCYAASVIDGSAIAVQYWKGEVVRESE